MKSTLVYYRCNIVMFIALASGDSFFEREEPLVFDFILFGIQFIDGNKESSCNE